MLVVNCDFSYFLYTTPPPRGKPAANVLRSFVHYQGKWSECDAKLWKSSTCEYVHQRYRRQTDGIAMTIAERNVATFS